MLSSCRRRSLPRLRRARRGIPKRQGRPRAATEEDIGRTITAFRDAAVRAQRAGFAGVELHGAHGYLLGQFLSRTGNTRSDGWGGSLPGRARLMREVTRAVRAAVSPSFLVGMRLSPEDFGQAKGLDLDENLTLAGWLCEDGIDFLHVSLWQSSRNTTKRPDQHPVPLFRQACPADVRLFAAGATVSRGRPLHDAVRLLAADAGRYAFLIFSSILNTPFGAPTKSRLKLLPRQRRSRVLRRVRERSAMGFPLRWSMTVVGVTVQRGARPGRIGNYTKNTSNFKGLRLAAHRRSG